MSGKEFEMISSDNQILQDSKLRKLSNQPKETTIYYVNSQDTLRSIAVTCSTTTSALMKLNRLPSTYIYPGQILFLPKVERNNSECNSPINSSPISNDLIGDEFSFLAPLSPSMSPLTEATPNAKKFHDLAMVSAPDQCMQATKESLNQFPPSVNCNGILEGGSVVSNLLASTQFFGSHEGRNLVKTSAQFNRMSSHESIHLATFEEKFIKTKAHLVTTSQDFVRGTFLVTLSSVMFDPDQCDPLTIENGYKAYEVMHKIKDIDSATMYKGTRRLQSRGSNSGLSALAKKVSIENDDPADVPTNDVVMTCGDVTTDIGTSSTCCTQSDHHEKLNFVTDDDNTLSSPDLKEDSILQTSIPLKLLFDSHKLLHQLYPRCKNVLKTKTEEKSQNACCCHGWLCRRNLLNNITVDVIQPTVLLKLQKQRDFNYFYLCIQTSVMKIFSFINPATKSREEQNDQKKPNVKKEVKRNCFEVPERRSDSLLSFFMQWSPDNYTLDFAEQNGFIITEPINEMDLPKRKATQSKRSKERSRSDSDSISGSTDSCFLDEKYFEKEWEIISSEEAKRRSSMSLMDMANDDSSIIPELLDPCPLLNDDTLLALCKHLPPRSIGYPWKLMYSTNEHGMSLKTLYRNMNPPEDDSPCLVLIQDVEQNIFGAFCSSQPRMSDHFYGNGECFLFKLSPSIEFYDWTGNNNFFVTGNSNSIVFGGGNGTAGLWFDEKILYGRSQPCSTYNNATLSCQEDFVIQTLEVWGIDG